MRGIIGTPIESRLRPLICFLGFAKVLLVELRIVSANQMCEAYTMGRTGDSGIEILILRVVWSSLLQHRMVLKE